MDLNLRHISFKRALEAAKDISRLTNEEITNRSGLDHSSVSRYFNPNDSYEPSPQKIPALCRALGNTVPADWVRAQIEDMKPQQQIVSATELAGAIMQTTANNGKLAQLTREALEDGEISQEDAIRLQAKILKNSNFLKELADSLEPLARGGQRGQVMTCGTGWQNVTIPGGVK